MNYVTVLKVALFNKVKSLLRIHSIVKLFPIQTFRYGTMMKCEQSYRFGFNGKTCLRIQ